MAKPKKTLELNYPMIQFLIMLDTPRAGEEEARAFWVLRDWNGLLIKRGDILTQYL